MRNIWIFLKRKKNREALLLVIAAISLLGTGIGFIWRDVIRTVYPLPKTVTRDIQENEPPPQSTNMTASADNGASAVVASDNAQVTIEK